MLQCSRGLHVTSLHYALKLWLCGRPVAYTATLPIPLFQNSKSQCLQGSQYNSYIKLILHQTPKYFFRENKTLHLFQKHLAIICSF